MTKKKAKKLTFGTVNQCEESNKQSDVFPNRLPIEKVRAIWNDEHIQYTDEQLYTIREWVYSIAGIIIHNAENDIKIDNNIISLNTQQNEEQESNFIHPDRYKQAG